MNPITLLFMLEAEFDHNLHQFCCKLHQNYYIQWGLKNQTVRNSDDHMCSIYSPDHSKSEQFQMVVSLVHFIYFFFRILSRLNNFILFSPYHLKTEQNGFNSEHLNLW